MTAVQSADEMFVQLSPKSRQEGNMSERVQFERYRIQVISTWPESGLKRAALASARAALEHELALINPRDALGRS
jgi:hypothetical protein